MKMNVYFTADYHLDHPNIILYCGRPFIKYRYIQLGNLFMGDVNPLTGGWLSETVKKARCQEMNLDIVKKHNKKVKEEDLIYHVGDFCFKGVGNAQYWEQQLNGNIVHIKGNHDKNNGVKTYLKYCIMEWGGLGIYVRHNPPEENQVGTLEARIIDSVDLILCGHVHGLWKHKYIPYNVNKSKLCINIGIDVWGEPVTMHTIMKYVSKVNRKVNFG